MDRGETRGAGVARLVRKPASSKERDVGASERAREGESDVSERGRECKGEGARGESGEIR
jgi:hypothetical protein